MQDPSPAAAGGARWLVPIDFSRSLATQGSYAGTIKLSKSTNDTARIITGWPEGF